MAFSRPNDKTTNEPIHICIIGICRTFYISVASGRAVLASMILSHIRQHECVCTRKSICRCVYNCTSPACGGCTTITIIVVFRFLCFVAAHVQMRAWVSDTRASVRSNRPRTHTTNYSLCAIMRVDTLVNAHTERSSSSSSKVQFISTSHSRTLDPYPPLLFNNVWKADDDASMSTKNRWRFYVAYCLPSQDSCQKWGDEEICSCHVFRLKLTLHDTRSSLDNIPYTTGNRATSA